MIIHRKVIQSLGKKKKRVRLNYKSVGDYKFKVRYDFDSFEELMEQKKYLLSLGWEVRYEKLKDNFILRGYYDVKETEQDSKTGRVFREHYTDRRCIGIIQPEILEQKKSFRNGRKENVQNMQKRAEGKTGKVLLSSLRK